MYRLITIISILVCFFPIIILFLKGVWKEKLYMAIAIYWLINGLINIAALLDFHLDPEIDDKITMVANYLDVPLVLLIFYLATSGMYRKIVKLTLIAFVIFEVVITAIKGFNFEAVTIILGVSLIVIIGFSVAGIIAYLTRIEHSLREDVMVFVYSSFLFFYGSFIIVYVFSYLLESGNDTDNFFIYYLELLVASLPVIYGFVRFASIPPKASPARPKMDGF